LTTSVITDVSQSNNRRLGNCSNEAGVYGSISGGDADDEINTDLDQHNTDCGRTCSNGANVEANIGSDDEDKLD
jgi:hypothetical protein